MRAGVYDVVTDKHLSRRTAIDMTSPTSPTFPAAIHNDRHGGADERAGAVIGVLGLRQCALCARQRRPRRAAPQCSRGARREGQQRGAAGTRWGKTGCMLGRKRMLAVLLLRARHHGRSCRQRAPRQPAFCCRPFCFRWLVLIWDQALLTAPQIKSLRLEA